MSAPSPGAADARRMLRGLRADGDEDALARAVWSIITEPGDAVAGRLVAAMGAGAALAVATEGAGAARGPEIDGLEAGRERWAPRLATLDRALEDALDRARRVGARLIIPEDAAWPRRLADLGEHAPHALWVVGERDIADPAPALAIVGARASTGYGEHVATELAAEAAAAGVVVVSGAAYGIDGAAHRGALAGGGVTVALLAGGVDRPYPAGHTDLLRRIRAHGAVVAETPCGTAPSKWRFLARNRLIAALSDATVVVEAGVRSGSLNTAAHAATLGRPLGAVPGPVTSAASAGCHRLLRDFDAMCVTGVADALELVGIAPGTGPAGPAADRDMLRLLDAASTRTPRGVGELARGSGMSEREVQARIGLAVLAGDLVPVEGGWRRAPARAAPAAGRADTPPPS